MPPQKSELDKRSQKYKRRVVLRGDVVKDDSGPYAVFTEQGSFAPHMTAADVLDVISRLQGCAGQARDAVSAYTQGKNGSCAKVIGLPQSGAQQSGFVYDDHTAQKSGDEIQDPVVPPEKNCTDTQWQDCCGNDNLKGS